MNRPPQSMFSPGALDLAAMMLYGSQDDTWKSHSSFEENLLINGSSIDNEYYSLLYGLGRGRYSLGVFIDKPHYKVDNLEALRRPSSFVHFLT